MARSTSPISQRLPRAIALGAVAAVLPLVAGLTPASAAATSSPSGLQAVPTGISAAALPGATVFGNTPPTTPETVSFVLQAQGLPWLEAQVEMGVQHYLSVAQFAQIYGQSPANISLLQSYLAHYGITTQVYPDNLDVVASGTAGEFDAALSVQQQQYSVPALPGHHGMPGVPSQFVHGTAQSPLLPIAIARFVLAILGLTNYGPFTSQAIHPSTGFTAPQAAGPSNPSGSGNPVDCLSLTGLPDACNLPSDFASNYDLGPLYAKGAEGAGQTVGIVDLAALDPDPSGQFTWAPQYFWQDVANVPPSTRTLSVVNVDGGPTSSSCCSYEADLDVEQAGAVAPDANVVVYQAPNTDYGYADALLQAASDNLASSVSMNWDASETVLQAVVLAGQASPGFAAAFEEAYMEMAVQGQSAFVPSGDGGAYQAWGDLGTTNLSVGYNSSPFVTVAGGTTLPTTFDMSYAFTGTRNPAAVVTVPSQRTWAADYGWQAIALATQSPLTATAESWADGSGGGFSTFYPTPSYQQGVPGTHFFDRGAVLHADQLPDGAGRAGRADGLELQPHASGEPWFRLRTCHTRPLGRRRPLYRLPALLPLVRDGIWEPAPRR